jgi:protein phosphatase
VAARSAVGPVRPHNQEAVAVFPLDGGAPRVCGAASRGDDAITGAWPADAGVGLLVVDGIGGQSTGDWACEAVIDALAERFRKKLPGDVEARGEWLAGALHEASARVTVYAKERSGPHGSLGATVVLVVAVGHEVHVLHVGDVRAYLFRDGRLGQLTQDDSLVDHHRAYLGRDLTEEERHQIKNVVTQALGFTGDNMKPHAQVLDARAGDVLMICTPGLHGFVDAGRVEAELGRAVDLEAACAELEALAVRGGTDNNLSVLLARFEEDQPSGT